MQRSGQIHSISHTNLNDIKKELESIQNTDDKKFPYRKSLLLTPDKQILQGEIILKFIVNRVNTVDSVHFEIKKNHFNCYIVGKREGRDELCNHLNRLLSITSTERFITTNKIQGEQIFSDMLKEIVKIDSDQYVKFLDLKFGMGGWKTPLNNHSVTVMKYGFVNNYCVSKDKHALDYVKNAIETTVTFGIWKLGDIEIKKTKVVRDKTRTMDAMSLAVKDDYSFRWFKDLDVSSIFIAMKLLEL